ncbi:PAS domain S-box protein [Methanococcoides sp. SA1]|nr:PAS domain S-box protein [Methanococcoides sp. SA1]
MKENISVRSIRNSSEKSSTEFTSLSGHDDIFQNISDHSRDAIIIIDNSGKIVYWNYSAEFLFEYSEKEALNKDVHDLICPDKYMKQCVHALDSFKRTGKGDAIGKILELEGLTKSQKIIPIEFSLSAVKMSDGLCYASAIIRDISERKKLEAIEREEKKNLEAVLNNSLSGYMLVDASSREILSINSIALEMIGLQKGEVLGKVCHEFVCPAERKNCPVLDLHQDVDCSERILITKKDKIPIYKSVNHFYRNGQKILVESFVDISKFKKIEEHLIQAKEESDAAHHTKMEFIAKMSHELRTPLNSIIGFSEVLDSQIRGPLNEKQTAYVSNIFESGTHLLKLINEILEISKIEFNDMPLNYEKVNLTDIIDESMVFINPMAKKRNISVSINIDHESLELNADKMKLKQIIYNLLSNATRFTPENGSIDVNSVIIDDMVQISISDTGIGISKENFDRIFEPFKQTGSFFTREYGGTGLGLSIVKSYVEIHGGKIWVISELGKGSTFTFTMPVNN